MQSSRSPLASVLTNSESMNSESTNARSMDARSTTATPIAVDHRPPTPAQDPIEEIDTLVIGAGQAGLATGMQLQRHGIPFLILDASDRVGDAWRQRWDSLRLFTSARFDALPGLPFPAAPNYFPTKDEMADYLEAYAQHFALPLRLRTRVRRLAREQNGFLVETAERNYRAQHVIVAMANYQEPKVPDIARALDRSIAQLHAKAYRGPQQLRDGGVLLVGAGNSGAEIAMDVCGSHATWLAGRSTGEIPFRVNAGATSQLFQRLVVGFVFRHVLTLKTPIGRKLRPVIVRSGGPLIRQKAADLARAGITRVPRVTGAREGLPLLADGRTLDVANVIWCTGYRAGFEWIDIPLPDVHDLTHRRGQTGPVPGLHFVGLEFGFALSSSMVHGVGRDAARVARELVRQRGRGAAARV